MKNVTIVVSACTFLLSGCDFVRVLLPRQATTFSEVQAQLDQCRIAPESISWTVGTDGTFAFGRKIGNAAPMTEVKTNCLMQWVTDNRIKVAFVGWEKSSQ